MLSGKTSLPFEEVGQQDGKEEEEEEDKKLQSWAFAVHASSAHVVLGSGYHDIEGGL